MEEIQKKEYIYLEVYISSSDIFRKVQAITRTNSGSVIGICSRAEILTLNAKGEAFQEDIVVVLLSVVGKSTDQLEGENTNFSWGLTAKEHSCISYKVGNRLSTYQ